MKWYRTILLAVRTLRRNPLRSLLMMLGITVGIASLTAMTSVGEATKEQTLEQFKNMVGTYDVVNIQPGAARTRGMPSLTTVEPSLKFEDAAALAAEATMVAQVAEVQNAFDIDVKYRDRTTASAIYGVSASWLEMHSYYISMGNILSEEDDLSLARVAVIGKDVREQLFPGQDPLGKQLRIANVPFQVKGVLESRGAGPGGSSLDNIVFIPVMTASKRLFNRDYLTTITVQLKNPEEPDAAIEEIAGILRDRHGIVPPVEDDFTIGNPRAAVERIMELRSTLSTVMTGVSVIATIIGGIVIMSLMLIAVSERRREIGVRRAVGATRTDVMFQFLVEAAVIAVLGGIVGVLFGIGSSIVVILRQELPTVIVWEAVLGALVVSATIGLIFGLQPAWKAANVDPIESLRA